jgi:hypothetical protein
VGRVVYTHVSELGNARSQGQRGKSAQLFQVLCCMDKVNLSNSHSTALQGERGTWEG